MPSEFSRQPRSLKDLDRQKEFRQFLLYTGPMVLQDIISDNAYEHFLALSITLTILLQSDDQNRCQYLDYARDLIQNFVYNSKYLYGNTFTVYNIHNLLHLPDGCFYHSSSLNAISCFPFENFLQRLKKVVQVVKLQEELEVFGSLPNFVVEIRKNYASKFFKKQI